MSDTSLKKVRFADGARRLLYSENMDFKSKKLSLQAIPEMRVCPVSSVQLYAPLPAPLYVLMSSNEKFLAVKAPLDFLTSAEIDKLRAFEFFYYPPFISQVLPFRTTARSVLGLLEKSKTAGGLRPAPYELSDAFLRMTASLWSSEARVEPFFVMAFVTEFCGAFAEKNILRAREENMNRYEQAVLKSAWAVWQALHLDFFDVDSLKALRNSIFETCAFGGSFSLSGFDREWIRNLIHSEIQTVGLRLSDLSSGVIRQKLESREKRLIDQLVSCNSEPFPSIFGEAGFYAEAG